MLHRIGLILILSTLALPLAYGQAVEQSFVMDTTVNVGEVVVTTSRTPVSLQNVTQPVNVITRQQLQQMSAQRLDAVLAEQTGIVLTQDHGTGLQLQGIDDDYILILIDGEPLVGRTAGTLDLTRITVENIERIEIVKGPASSLYGSEALGGVINIITREPDKAPAADLHTRYGANETSDLGLNLGANHKGWRTQLSLNRFSSAGYDLAPETRGTTVSPFENYTGAFRVGKLLGTRWRMDFSMRGFWEDQSPEIGTADDELVTGRATQREYNLHPGLTFYATDAVKLRFHAYSTGYHSEEDLRVANTDSIFSQSFFAQTFQRPELQADIALGEQWHLVAGGGSVFESVDATRYSQRQRQQTHYGFLQATWQPTDRWHWVVGARYDATDRYGSQLSPKLATRYELSKSVSLRASVGVGFKAPDFRQLYLNFTNAAIGYSVFGTVEAAQLVEELDAAGQITDLFIPANALGQPLTPETSVGINVGGTARLQPSLQLGFNVFFNQINNLIETIAIARKVNNQSVFSYGNLGTIQTYGTELDLRWQPLPGLQVNAGYQYLITTDLEVLEDLDAGRVFVRNARGRDVRLDRSDYAGLFNRSAHTANLRVFYRAPDTGWEGSLRATYRSRFALFDTNGNAILDDYDTYVDGYMLLNLSAGKRLTSNVLVQAGADNLLNYTDPQNIPGLPGRLWFIALQLQLGKADTASSNP